MFQLGQYMHEGHLNLPPNLLSFFHTKCIQIVGVGIKGDLIHLFNNCGFDVKLDPPFLGALELGGLCKEKHPALQANIGLADLCSSVLQKYLLKDPSIRISEGWNSIPLSEAHANYAALDIYATWKVFCALH